MLYALFVFLPAQIYIFLATGQMPTGVQWFALLFLVEIAALFGSSFTKHEAILVFSFATFGFVHVQQFVNLIYAEWLRVSPIAKGFGFAEKIPSFYSPPLETGVWEARTFFHESWLLPILIPVTTFSLGVFLSIALGLFGREIYIEAESLPFPVQEMTAQAVITLTERKEPRKIQLMSLCVVVGFIYGFLVYTSRFITSAMQWNLPWQIPIPWIDMNMYIQQSFPGASFGIATDINFFSLGLFLPTIVNIGVFLGSFAIYFLGSWLSVSYNLSPVKWWVPNMNIQLALQRSIMYFWAPILIGISIAAGLVPLFSRPQVLFHIFNVLRKKPSTKERKFPEEFSVLWIILPVLFASLYSILLTYYLAPDFPIWVIAVLNFLMPILLTIIGGRLSGEAGISFTPQYINETAILASGYKGTDAWFTLWAGSWTSLRTGEMWCSLFRALDLTNTSMRSMILGRLIQLPIAIILSFIFVQLFWSLSPIPSVLYPGTQIFWPIQATYQGLWLTRPPELFRIEWIVGSFTGMAIIHLLFSRFFPTALPVSIAAGCGTPIPYAVSQLIGGIVGLVVSIITGKEFYNSHKQIIAAGLTMGEGISIVFGVCFLLIVKSMWVMPY